jgi:hypothetical protein
MAGLYDRVASRGFPSPGVVDGQTGAGALDSQGHPVDPSHGDMSLYPGGGSQTLPEYDLEGAAAPVGVPVLDGTFGLPGGSLEDIDVTPRTHAAPGPGWAGSYAPSADLDQLHENSADIHSADFGALANRRRIEDAQDESHMEWETWRSNDPGESVQVPLEGAARSIGRQGDAVQGYDLRNRYGFDAGHRERTRPVTHQPMAYLDPSERPFIVPQPSGSFTPDDAVQGPGGWYSIRAAENINATPPTAYEPPPEPPTSLAAAGPAGGAANAGWWS